MLVEFEPNIIFTNISHAPRSRSTLLESCFINNNQDDDNDQVLLVVEDGGANPETLELRSTDVKAYDENHIISPKERRELRAKYVEVLFAGISAGNFFRLQCHLR